LLLVADELGLAVLVEAAAGVALGGDGAAMGVDFILEEPPIRGNGDRVVRLGAAKRLIMWSTWA